MALYGKYRPKNFEDLVGQEAIKTTLQHAISGDLVSHAYLLCGSRGTGKTSSARILAKAINCTNIQSNGNPCGTCEFCKAAENGKMTDLIEIDAASNRGIDEIRDLREKIAFAPNFGKAKIYIIDEVHMLTKEAFNALLKTLEEPPIHAYFILATTEFHKVPETIRSRCQTFFFKKITKKDIVHRLEHIATSEQFEYEHSGLELLADRSDGGLRDAISLLEQCAAYGSLTSENLIQNLGILSPHILEEFFHALERSDTVKTLQILDAIQDEGRSLEEFSKQFIGFLRKKFHTFLEEKSPHIPWILQVIEIFSEASSTIKSSEIPALALEIAIAKTLVASGGIHPHNSHETMEKDISSLPKENPPTKKLSEGDTFPPPSTQKSPPSLPKKTSDITMHWEKICEALPSSLKNILLSAPVEQIENGEIRITIASTTFRERAEKQKETIEKVCEEVLEQKIQVNFVGEEGISTDEFENMLQNTV